MCVVCVCVCVCVCMCVRVCVWVMGTGTGCVVLLVTCARLHRLLSLKEYSSVLLTMC